MSDESPPDGAPDDDSPEEEPPDDPVEDPIFRTDETASSEQDPPADDAPEAGDAVDAAFDPIEDEGTAGGAAGSGTDSGEGATEADRGEDATEADRGEAATEAERGEDATVTDDAPAAEGDAEDLFGEDDSADGYELAVNERRCAACGFVIDADAVLCPECGARQEDEGVAAGPDLNPILSGVLSFFLPGLGQLYNGQTTRAAVTFVVWVAWFGAILFGWLLITLLTGGLALVAVIVLPVIDAVYHGIAAVDAYVQAGKIDRGEKAP